MEHMKHKIDDVFSRTSAIRSYSRWCRESFDFYEAVEEMEYEETLAFEAGSRERQERLRKAMDGLREQAEAARGDARAQAEKLQTLATQLSALLERTGKDMQTMQKHSASLEARQDALHDTLGEMKAMIGAQQELFVSQLTDSVRGDGGEDTDGRPWNVRSGPLKYRRIKKSDVGRVGWVDL